VKRVLFDQGVPVPLRNAFAGSAHVETVYELGWSTVQNGALILRAQSLFDVFVTTDKNLRYQQNLTERTLAIVVLPTTQWPKLRERADEIARVVIAAETGAFIEIASSV
jgi:predicted nucleotidyltransferase